VTPTFQAALNISAGALVAGSDSKGNFMKHLLIIESTVSGAGYILFQRCKELGYRLTFVTRDPEHYTRGMSSHPSQLESHPIYLSDEIIVTETNDIQNLLKQLEHLYEKHPFDGATTLCDYYLKAVAHVAQHFGLVGNDPDVVDTAINKGKMRKKGDELGLPMPGFHVARTLDAALETAQEMGYPLVVKPVDLCGSMHVTSVENPLQLENALKKLAQVTHNARKQSRPAVFLLEEFIHGQEVSVETITRSGRTEIIGITDKLLTGFPHFIEQGHMFPAELAPAQVESISSFVVGAFEKFGVRHGVAHTELKLTDKGLRIVEVNLRRAGNRIDRLIHHVTGVDLNDEIIRMAVGDASSVSSDKPVYHGSAAVEMLVPREDGKVAGIRGLDHLEGNPYVTDWEVKVKVGDVVQTATNNNSYMGHVMVYDPKATNAREQLQTALESFQIDIGSA
jgi:biotin carboxylase